jgi:hypothetical protein
MRKRALPRAICPAANTQAKPFIVSGAGAFDEAPTFLRKSGGALHPQRGANVNPLEERFMSKKPLVKKPAKKIADARRVRYGAGSAPRVVRALDSATRDSRAVRFGAGSAPASLRK